jgi:glycosyltransferase involved in cell wall biosynthesis
MKPALRVMHLTGGSGPDALGVGRAVYNLARAQRALGHDVSIVSEQAEHIDESRSLTADRSPLLAARTRLARRTRQVAPTLARELLEQRLDVIHLHSIHVPENVSLARYLRNADVPYCVTIHGGLSRVAQQRGRVKKAAMWWLGEGQYLNHALFIHALTCEEARDIGAYGVTAPTVVAPNGIDAETLPRPVDPCALFARVPELAGHRVLMFMGRVAPIQKGLDLLLHGLALANLPDWRLVLLGPDWRGGRAWLERLAEQLGLRSQLTFFDRECPQRCADLMAGADAFVHTSRWEGMSLSVLEAALWGKPCLLTRAADPNGSLGDQGGALIVDGAPEEIAAGLRKMAGLDRAALLAMGQRAHQTVVSQYTWNRAASKLIDAYRDGLDRR